jgi:hypothetical protein
MFSLVSPSVQVSARVDGDAQIASPAIMALPRSNLRPAIAAMLTDRHFTGALFNHLHEGGDGDDHRHPAFSAAVKGLINPHSL